MEQKLTQKQKQQFLLAPQMQQSIHVLQLPFIELKDLILKEVENNPCLEIQESNPQHQEVFSGNKRYGIHPSGGSTAEFEHELQAKQPTLQECLLRQMRLTFCNKRDLQIAELIIGSLDERGYLVVSVEELAKITNVELEIAEAVLTIVQTFDPVGCGSRNVKECLLAQLRSKDKQCSLVYKIVESYLEELAGKKFIFIAKQLKVSLDDVKSAIREVPFLEPNPARNFSHDDRSIYVIPDITVDIGGDKGYGVTINDGDTFFLRINNFYKSLLIRKDIPSEEKDFIRERISAGHNFMKCIQMRKETIKRLAEYLVKFQEEFLDKGRQYIRPLTFKQVAQEIGRDESTVCRAVNNKYIDTPQGILRLKDFFSNEAVKTEGVESVSSASIKERIRGLIENEDKKKPLSDEDILKQLESKSLKLSRRTIAKYRTQLKILPSYLRKE
ncbi:MAG: RNA polymerase factor sigma-54 [Candidatus Omnitrophota bacterium]|nr:RNA polymerase factor sigma-54 [Candidatus Omnitrophota bacterium]